MKQNKWEYGGVYRQYNMDGVISLPKDSQVKVCDITKELPEFMLKADTLFIDPPCSTGNLRTFHTKSDQILEYDFQHFINKLFECIDIIAPKYLFLEVFKSNKLDFLKIVESKFKNVVVYDSFYYNNRKNKCYIIQATNEELNKYYENLNDIDEEKAIKWICQNHQYDCIGDLCMGRGLVGKYAYLNGKSFVGTELNKKRLAVLIDFINQHERDGT